jgi:DNA-binding NtrC family response regulator
MPTLTVLALTDSLAEWWPALAAEAGLSPRIVAEAAAVAGARAGAPNETSTAHDAGIVLVSGAGQEDAIEPALRALSAVVGEETNVATVGTLPDHRLAVALMRAGAAAYFALPGDRELLARWVRENAERRQQALTGDDFSRREAAKYRFEGILGDSAALKAALDRVARVIPHRSVTVLLHGETGTGKELVARAIHYNGPRAAAPFVDVNCAAIPDNLLESELFGHEKGAFTGATAAKPGLFELADGGTLFLDEIGHLALPLQGKLLRALQEREVRRVGGSRSVSIDVRVIAATHVDLAAASKRGEFREDLYWRLAVVPVELPPLRQRRGDALVLARHFLARYATEYGRDGLKLGPAAEQAITSRDWPGNVRELRNAIERAVLLSPDAVLDPAFFDAGPMSPSHAEAGALPFPATLDDIEQSAARAMVAFCGGNKSEAARRLAISRTRLLRLLDGAGADAPTSDDESD